MDNNCFRCKINESSGVAPIAQCPLEIVCQFGFPVPPQLVRSLENDNLLAYVFDDAGQSIDGWAFTGGDVQFWWITLSYILCKRLRKF